MAEIHPIIIVGMGPVGMTAALSLARRGHQVTVLEAGEDLASESRASTFHPSSLEVLSELGIVDELIDIGLRAPGFQYRGTDGELIAHLDMGALADETRFPFRVQCEQSKLTRIIRPHLEALPNVTLRFGAPVERVEVGTDCALVYLPGDGLEPSYRADWLIAADGANSAVRRSLGIAFEGVTYPERFLVASTTHDFRDDFDGLADINYVYDPEHWGVLLRTPDHWRVLFPIRDDEPDARAIDPERVEERLQGVVALDRPYPVLHSTIYKVHQRLARVFAVGRVLLAGDAAHINNPLGGMRMNSGIHDADAAVTAIEYALAGGDPERAAAVYAKVRRDAAALDVQKHTQKNYEEMREQNDETRRNTRAEMARTASDPVLLRTHLLRTSMLDSLRTSRRRMRRGLLPVHARTPIPAGRRLSDSIRGVPLGPEHTHFVPATEVPSDLGDLYRLTQATDSPVIVGLPAGDVTTTVQHLELCGVAGVVIPPSADGSTIDLARAIDARRDLVVIAALAPAPLDDVVAQAQRLAETGADLLLLPHVDDQAAQRIHRAVPSLPLAVPDRADQPPAVQLHLAGIDLVLATGPATDPSTHLTTDDRPAVVAGAGGAR